MDPVNVRALMIMLSVRPSDVQEFLNLLAVLLLIAVSQIPNTIDLTLRHRLFGSVQNTWLGRDVCAVVSQHPIEFFKVAWETPESLMAMMTDISPGFQREANHVHTLSPRNRLFMFLIWLRSYPSLDFLSLLFEISPSTVSREINSMRTIMWDTFADAVVWPTRQEWLNMRGNWSDLPDAVGAIDGTSHRIYKPSNEPQAMYFSGHRHFHCIHTMVKVDNSGILRFVRSGFLGHQNDAQILTFKPHIGENMELDFPADCLILGDAIFPNTHPIMTPFRNNQLRAAPPRLRRKYLKLNETMCSHRVKVEHAIRQMKIYRAIGTLWRHLRWYISSVVDICAAMAVRRVQLFGYT